MTRCIYFKVKHVSIAAEYSMPASVPSTDRRMASFNFTKEPGEPQCTRDFKYPHMSRLPVLPRRFLQHVRWLLSMIVWHFVDDPSNYPFPQNVVLNSVSHSMQ
ncbi:hypothetical protein CDAR_257721 [Caerostris darwini]|uniref:Uncharacterized protein n=1 Tax=Caerostris darwini TaxID=1538125 RepID=A0AAV4TCS7_9ARAC|nr:hypothetical protein CDAR_257721 [Caerostris darwini]